METEQKLNRYTKDLKEAELAGSGFWKVPEGETVVTCKTEISEVKEHTYPSGDKEQKRDIVIDVAGQEQTWSLRVGGKKSLYYKVLQIAEKRGTLAGAKLRILRQGKDKDDTRYMVFEA